MTNSPTPAHYAPTDVARINGPAPLPRRTSTSRASWIEYQRLLAAGVRPTAAVILATGAPRPATDETAYWRQLARHQPTTPDTRSAHAAAQRGRRAG